MLLKIQKYDFKIPGFRQKLPQNTKKLKKEKKIFLCIRPSVSKLKIHIVFFIHQKKCFSMHFGFNNKFIKVKRKLAKFSKKQQTFYFVCLLVSGYDFTRNAYNGYLIPCLSLFARNKYSDFFLEGGRSPRRRTRATTFLANYCVSHSFFFFFMFFSKIVCQFYFFNIKLFKNYNYK